MRKRRRAIPPDSSESRVLDQIFDSRLKFVEKGLGEANAGLLTVKAGGFD